MSFQRNLTWEINIKDMGWCGLSIEIKWAQEMKMVTPKWFYNEMKHSGVDYTDTAHVQAYDARHQRFRDYQKASAAIIEKLGIGPEHTVIDMGAGTGAFALCAAPKCKYIYAVDVSQPMLAYSRQKAEQMGWQNITFCHGGFLTYEHHAEPADAMVSVAVLHHLPDFWKLVGLQRAASMLKLNGKLFLFDVIFPSEMTGYEVRFNRWIQSMAEKVGAEFAAEAETHIRDEHSTFDWIMEGLLNRAGFRIDHAEYVDGYGATYLCTNAKE
jgi:putative AdoMet-dependent methyltransferase